MQNYKIKIVNLKKRNDRRKNIENIFKKINFENYSFYEAVDGKNIPLNLEIKNLFTNNDFGNRKCFIGCALSHYNIWIDLLKDKTSQYYIIFEDDIILSNYFTNNFEKSKIYTENNINTIDLLFLGYTYESNNLDINSYIDDSFNIYSINKNIFLGGTFSYIITKNGAKKMLDYIENNGIKHGIDYLFKINDSLKSYEVYPNIVFSKWVSNINDNVDSDIQKDIECFDFNSIYNYNNYLFIKNLDIINNDFKNINSNNIDYLIEQSNKYDDVVAFNSIGFLKTKVEEYNLVKSNYFNSNDGLFIKLDRIIRIKLICDWCSSSQLINEFNNMSKGDFKWNNLKIVDNDINIDYYVVINRSINNEYYDPKKTILFVMEPYCNNNYQKWGVKTWGFWSNPDESLFLEIRNHQKYYNNCISQLKESYNELSNNKIIKTNNNAISTIISSKYFDPGHIKRIDFLKYIESKNELLLDIYGFDNKHNFKNYIKPLSNSEKSIGLMQYKYYINVENNKEKNYITEKFWEAIMCESLIFYDGAPNITEYINPNAFVLIDLDDFEKSYNIIVESIKNNLWEKNIDIIRYEKYRVLNYFNFFPSLERIITKDLWNNNLNNKLNIYIIQNNEEILAHVKVFKDSMLEFGFDVIIIEKKKYNYINNIVKNNELSELLFTLNCYERILYTSKYENNLIIYDNMLLNSSYNNFFNTIKYLPCNYDFVQLYQEKPIKIIEQYNSLYYIIKKYYFDYSLCYFISKNGIIKILNYAKNNECNLLNNLIYECYENIEDFKNYNLCKNSIFTKLQFV